MQRKAIAVGETPPGSARGLGVCDALEVTIAPIQLVWLIDELDQALRGLEQLERKRETSAASEGREEDAAEDLAYRLALLRAMRARLPEPPVDQNVTFVGPSSLVMDAVRGATRKVTGSLSEMSPGPRPLDETWARALQKLASATAAWIETLIDCSAVVGFNFDREADPSQAW